MEETVRTQNRMEASSEEGQGTVGVAVPGMDG